MGWPRVVTGAAARILSMVMDIAQASVRRSVCVNWYQQQSSDGEGRTMNSKSPWRTQQLVQMELIAPFSKAALPPATCHLGSVGGVECPLRDALRGNRSGR